MVLETLRSHFLRDPIIVKIKTGIKSNDFEMIKKSPKRAHCPLRILCFRQMEKHLSNECRLALVSCEYKEVGCRLMVGNRLQVIVIIIIVIIIIIIVTITITIIIIIMMMMMMIMIMTMKIMMIMKTSFALR